MVNTSQTNSHRQVPAWVMLLVVLIGLGSMGYLAYWLLHGPSTPSEVTVTAPQTSTGPRSSRTGGNNRSRPSFPDSIDPLAGGNGGYRIKYDKLILHIETQNHADPNVECFPIWQLIIDANDRKLFAAAQAVADKLDVAQAAKATPDQIKQLKQDVPVIQLAEADRTHLVEAMVAYKQAAEDAKPQAEKDVFALVKEIEDQNLPRWKKEASDEIEHARQVLSADQLSKLQDYFQNPGARGRPAPRPQAVRPTTSQARSSAN